MTFGEAFEQVKKGKGMRVPYWRNDIVLRANLEKEFLYVDSQYGKADWKYHITDMFSNDWIVV